MASSRQPVTLHIYDLSQGMARQYSPMILGKTIDAIYHTSIVVYNTEYYFGGGICADPPYRTPYGTPMDTLALGTTTRSTDDFRAFLRSISAQFSMQTYHLLENNCNNFSDACAKYLLQSDTGIPAYIVDLPREAMDSPMGGMLRPMIENMQRGIRDQSAGHELTFSADGPALTRTSAPTPATAAPTAIAACAQTPVLLTRAGVAPVLAKLRELDTTYPAASAGDAAPAVADLLAAEKRAVAGKAFPALDLLRMAALRDVAAAAEVCVALPRLLGRHVLDGAAPRPDCMMALRIAVNAFKFEGCAVAVLGEGKADVIVEAAAVGLGHEHAAVTKTAAVLAMNIAGAPRRYPEKMKALSEELAVRLVFAAVERAKSEKVLVVADEAYPLLGAIAIIVNGDAESRELVRSLELDLAPYIDPERCPDPQARAVAIELDRILR
jgi:PPPDE putative peptidase domain/PUL domain